MPPFLPPSPGSRLSTQGNTGLNNSGSRGMLNLFSYPNYLDLRDRTDAFAGLIAYRFTPIGASAKGVNERLWGYLVSGNYFEVLGVRPAVGRA